MSPGRRSPWQGALQWPTSRSENLQAAGSKLVASIAARRALDPGLIEAPHLRVEPRGKLDQREGQRRATRLTEAEAQVEQRFQSELGQDVRVGRFGGAVAGDQVIAKRRLQTARDQSSDAGGKTVEQDQPARSRGRKH